MGRGRRHFDADTLYLVKNICADNQARFTPTPKIEESIRGLLSKYATVYNIRLVAFIFKPHAFWILLQGPELNIDKFMCVLQTCISKDINRFQGRRGSVFADRYTAEPVLEDKQEDILRELIAQPCLDDMVEHPRLWTGVSSWSSHISGEEFVGHRLHTGLYWAMRQSPEYVGYSDQKLREMATLEYRVRLEKLPVWKKLSDEECAEKIRGFAEEAAERREVFWAAVQAESEEQVLIPCIEDVLAYSDQRSLDFFKPIRRGRCHSDNISALNAFFAARKKRNKSYTQAARKLREGKKDVYFPAGMYPPGHLHCVGSPAAIRAGQNPQAPAAPAEPRQIEVSG